MIQPYDLILKGGRVIDPGQGLSGLYDVGIRAGQIAAVAPQIDPQLAQEWIDVADHLVLPGLIDTHAHVYQHVSGRFGLNADWVGVRSGVTTVVDQGGASCMTFPGFRHFIARPAATRVLAFISAYVVGGLEGHYYPQLYGPDGIDVEATTRVARANLDLIKGIKAHGEIGGVSRWGLTVLQLAKQISQGANLPLYVHLGQLWALPEGSAGVEIDQILPQVVELLEPGDILAHPFTRHPGGFVDQRGRVHPILQQAIKAGIRIDVGHGSHFSFQMAQKVLEAGIVPHTLGADMHGYNTQVPPEPGTPQIHPDDEMHPFAGQTNFSLIQAMNGLRACGLSLELSESQSSRSKPEEDLRDPDEILILLADEPYQQRSEQKVTNTICMDNDKLKSLRSFSVRGLRLNQTPASPAAFAQPDVESDVSAQDLVQSLSSRCSSSPGLGCSRLIECNGIRSPWISAPV